jgi:PAS domain S-box-containing protein
MHMPKSSSAGNHGGKKYNAWTIVVAIVLAVLCILLLHGLFPEQHIEIVGAVVVLVMASIVMIYIYRSTQKKLMATSEYARGLIEASLDPLVTIGPDGKITDVNGATEKITGVPGGELIGTDFADYFTEPEKARAGYQQVFREGVVYNYSLELRHKNGSVTPVLYNASVYKDRDGKVAGVFAAARDMADARRAEWVRAGLARLNDAMRGEEDVARLAGKIITELCTQLDAKVGVLYLAQDDGADAGILTLLGSYAHVQRKHISTRFMPGEGLVGQAALERKQIVLTNAPEDYIRVVSGLGETPPRQICVTPFMFQDRVRGVVEIGTLGELDANKLDYLSQAVLIVGVSFEASLGRARISNELARSQELSKKLQVQQEELVVSNEELEEQAQTLKRSEEKLQAQQEELQVMNEELEEKNQLLEHQKMDVELARKGMEEKAAEVELTSKYKSEFLANMSHELRTPLNSLLLLAQGLADNKEGNLTEDQVESVKVIYGSGVDLLKLISEILDLAKIEAGRMDIHIGNVKVGALADGIRSSFGHMAREKGIGLTVEVGGDIPTVIVSDHFRIEQVIRNLMSNAIKFTESGSVSVTFGRPAPGTDLPKSGLQAGECLAISVKDTGIGIAPEQHKVIFEAFQQADGSTSRKYGGTGLGLSIARELSRLLGGELRLTSEPGKGSTFTLYLPFDLTAAREAGGMEKSAMIKVSRAEPAPESEKPPRIEASLRMDDDRESVGRDDRIILIIEDDPTFARLLLKNCHERGFKCLAAATGEEGLELAAKHLPGAVILDIRLPGIDGWGVLTALKENTRTRHIPVHIISVEEPTSESLRKGAVGHATKPIDQERLEETFKRLEQVTAGTPKRMLVVEDNPAVRRSTVEAIGSWDVKVDEAGDGKLALEALRAGGYDCVVMDLGLPDMDGLEVLTALEREGVRMPPVIIHTARDLTYLEEERLREHAESVVIKDVRTQERLLDEVSLFLHRIVSQMPEKEQQIILNLHDSDIILRDKKVLIVEDDMRTMFALSKALADRGMKVLKADNGAKAIKLLEQDKDVDIVLMDIMLPVMDGYEAMTRIRAQEAFRNLPIIALTAKVMKHDRDKCIAAGANDYLPKPLDQNRLISMMRVWLFR